MMDKVKWGVIGTAYIFERDTALGMKLADNCEMYAVAGRNPVKAMQFKEKYGFVKAYGSYDELLLDPDVEAVYIALPNNLHYEWTMKALRHKKHVLCEKPLAPTAYEASQMFRAAEENGVYLMEAFAYQHSPYIKAVKEEVKSGTIGEILYMEAALITSDYVKENIRMQKGTFGGCTYDVGVYAISLIQSLMGREPVSVKAISSSTSDGVDMYSTGIFEYENGARASFDCGMVLATEKNSFLDRFQIHGTKGSISSLKFNFNAPGTLSYVIRDFEGGETVKEVEVPQNYSLEISQLGRCVRGAETPYLTEDFSVPLARTVDRVLAGIGY